MANEFGYNYMKDLLSIPGVYNAIDVISDHAYHPGRNVREVDVALTRTQNLARGKPVWLTETSVPSDGGKEFQSPAWQAEILARTVVLALAYRVERFFWHTLFDPCKGKTSKRREILSFAANSLHSKASPGSPLELKPAGKVYRTLAKVLGDIKWKDIKSIEVAGGKGIALGNNKWLVYSDRATFPIAFSANRGKALVSGREIVINQRNNQAKVFGNTQVVILEKGN